MVAVSDDNANLMFPTSVQVPSGAISATFTGSATIVTSVETALVTASANGSSKTTPISLQVPSNTPTMIAGYGMDEGSGATISDASGNGNTGQIQGATWSTTAKYGKAVSFNGINSSVDLGQTLTSTASMSWTAWVYAIGNASR